jgi:hypothetical protein
MSSTQYSVTQQVNFAKNSDPAQGISLCIPRVFNNINHRRIKKHIIEAKLGFVERVDVISVQGGKFKRAFVHFAPNRWNMGDEISRNALSALQSGKKIKLEYEAPWYWIVGISGAERPKEAPNPYERRTTIDITHNAVQHNPTQHNAVQSKAPVLTRQTAAPPFDTTFFSQTVSGNAEEKTQ